MSNIQFIQISNRYRNFYITFANTTNDMSHKVTKGTKKNSFVSLWDEFSHKGKAAAGQQT